MTAWGQLFPAGSTPEETAKIIVHDRKFGMRGKAKAIEDGDKIIPLIKKESKDFQGLDDRNSFWIAEVLGSIDSELSRKTLKELHQRRDGLAPLVGSIGLGMHGAFPEEIDENSPLVKIVRKAHSKPETELAIIALGYSGSAAALPPLHDLLSRKPNRYWHNVHACEALARIRSVKSIPVLRECVENPGFLGVSLSAAYRAAISHGDKASTGLAIARISEDPQGKLSSLVKELERVTGLNYGYDKEKWEDWWASDGKDWKIPKQFLIAWDEQPGLL